MNEAIKKLRDAVDHVEQELTRISRLKGEGEKVLVYGNDLADLLHAFETGAVVHSPALARLCEAVGRPYITKRIVNL